MIQQKHQEYIKGYEKKIFKYSITTVIFLHFLTFLSGQTISERVLCHLNNEKKVFEEGVDTYGDFKIVLDKLKKRNFRLKIVGKVLNETEEPLGFFNFYIVELSNSNIYKIIKEVGQSNIEGNFKISTKLYPNQFLFVTSKGFLVRSIVPQIIKKRRILIE